MQAIVILTRCRDAAEDIRALEERLARLRACVTNTAAPPTNRDAARVQRHGVSKSELFLGDITECEAALAARLYARDVEELACCRIVDMLPMPERDILYRYYVARETVRCIATAMGYSAGYIKQRKRNGLTLIAEISEDAVDAQLPDWYLAQG